MRILLYLAIYLAALCPSIAYAYSDDVQALAVPSFGADGKFDFCAMEHEYQNRTAITIAISPLGEFNLGVTIPEAGFKKGARYDLMLGFDGQVNRKIRARAIRNNTVLLQLGTDRSFAEAFDTKKALEVSGGEKTIKFSTTPIRNAVTELELCVKNNKSKVIRSTTDLPGALVGLLYESGIKDAVPVSMDNIPPDERPADFVWKTGNVLGGIKEIKVSDNKDLSTLIGLHINGLKHKCSGAFSASVGKETVTSYFKLRSAIVSCKMKEGEQDSDITVALLYSLSTHKLFTVFSNETGDTYKQDAIAIRDALSRALQKDSQN